MHEHDAMLEKYAEGKIFFDAGLFAKAQKIFFSLTLNYPTNWEFWFSLGASYQAQKQYLSAASSYLKATILNSKNAIIYYKIAECMLSMDEKKNALSMLEIAKSYASDESLIDKIILLTKQNQVL